ncbi:MAG: hypothetical protein R6X02_17360 [Enhygromyxa sp.]
MLAPLVLCLTFAFAPEPAADDLQAQARALFDSGQARYETHDYGGAIADFTAAYNLALDFDDPSLRDEALARLAFNLARAHVSAHDLDGDPSHLELARRLLADYRGHERQMGRDPDTDTDLERLELDLLARERELAPAEGPQSEQQQEPPVEARPRARAQRRAGVSLLAISPAFAGLAVGGGIMASKASEDFAQVTTGEARLDTQRRGRVGDVLLGVGVGLAAASAITGVALLVIGRSGKTRDLALHLRPTGVTLEGRF